MMFVYYKDSITPISYDLVMWVACYGELVVKNWVHAGKQTFLPQLATFMLWCYQQCYLWVLSLIVASWGAHTQFTFQKYPN